MSYFVSRQMYYGEHPSQGTVVEIADGGRDYANPDMLVEKWPRLGEGREYDDPREAVAVAIAICNAWRANGERRAKVAYGHTGGNTLPFEPCTYRDARAWAEARWEAAPKCAQCGGLLPDACKRWCPMYADFRDETEACCSERCAEKRDSADTYADSEVSS